MPLMSMRAYARLRGVSVEAVSKAAKMGRISTVLDERGKRKIDPELADREWVRNTDQSKYREPEPLTPRPFVPAQEPPAPEVEATPPEEEKPKGPTYAQSRAVREVFSARLAKLEFEQKSGRLVDGEEMRKLWVSVAGIVKTKILALPTKAKQLIPRLTIEEYEILERIARESLEELANERV